MSYGVKIKVGEGGLMLPIKSKNTIESFTAKWQQNFGQLPKLGDIKTIRAETADGEVFDTQMKIEEINYESETDTFLVTFKELL